MPKFTKGNCERRPGGGLGWPARRVSPHFHPPSNNRTLRFNPSRKVRQTGHKVPFPRANARRKAHRTGCKGVLTLAKAPWAHPTTVFNNAEPLAAAHYSKSITSTPITAAMPCGKVRWERPHDARPLEISRQEDEQNNNQRGIRVGYTPSVHRTVAHPATTFPSRTGFGTHQQSRAGEALKSTAEAGVKDSDQHPESGDAHPRRNT